MNVEDYNSQRDTANDWFDLAVTARRFAGDAARAVLHSDRKAESNFSSDKQIEVYTKEAEDVETA